MQKLANDPEGGTTRAPNMDYELGYGMDILCDLLRWLAAIIHDRFTTGEQIWPQKG